MKTLSDRLNQTHSEREQNLKSLQQAVGHQITHTPEPATIPNAFRLGMLVHGNEAPEGLTIRNNWVYLSSDHMLEHLLVLGSTGSGKTQFLLRLAHEVLFSPEDLDLYVIDGKGDPELAKRIAVMAHTAGKGAVPIMKLGWGEDVPSAVFDGFALGSNQAIYERLIAMFDLNSVQVGDAEFYRVQRRLILQMVCGVNTRIQYGVEIGEPPRDFAELQRRFNIGWLKATYAGSLEALIIIEEAEKKFPGFYAQLSEPINPLLGLVGTGGFKLGDSRVIVFSLNSEASSFNSEYLFRFIGESIRSYISTQPTGKLKRKTYWIIDEFSSFGAGTIEGIINQARSKRMSVTLAMLNPASMGEDTKVREGIKGCKTQVIFQHDDALELIRKAGTKFIADPTVRMEEGAEKGVSIGHREIYKIDPEEVRSLPRGACFISSRGIPIRMQVKMLDGFTEEEFDEGTMEDVARRNDVIQPSLKPYTKRVEPATNQLPSSNQPTPF